jgi:hypothetical protein
MNTPLRNRLSRFAIYGLAYTFSAVISVAVLTYETHPWTPYWPLLLIYLLIGIQIVRPTQIGWLLLCLPPLAATGFLFWNVGQIASEDLRRGWRVLFTDSWHIFMIFFAGLHLVWVIYTVRSRPSLKMGQRL